MSHPLSCSLVDLPCLHELCRSSYRPPHSKYKECLSLLSRRSEKPHPEHVPKVHRLLGERAEGRAFAQLFFWDYSDPKLPPRLQIFGQDCSLQNNFGCANIRACIQ